VIDRYSRPQMRELWSDKRKFEIWLEIETLACEAMADLGQIPKADAAEIRKRARFSISEIAEIEKRTNHDVIAFLENVAASVGPANHHRDAGATIQDDAYDRPQPRHPRGADHVRAQACADVRRIRTG
jgi:adenylosuccinate lyase